MTDLACPHGRKWTKCETCELIEAESRVTAMQEEIASWQRVHRAEHEKCLKLQEEIAALRAERATLSNGLMIQTDQVEHSEKVIEELEKVAEHAAALFYNHELTETWDALEEALRSAGYLKEDGDE
jgi:septal ring factor EnvC (AmiA/AmiB activator)